LLGSWLAGSSTTATFRVPSLGSEYDTGTTSEAHRNFSAHGCHDNFVTGGSVLWVVVALEGDVLVWPAGADVVACVPGTAVDVLHADATAPNEATATSSAARDRDTGHLIMRILAATVAS
jgi:hypothetical protein